MNAPQAVLKIALDMPEEYWKSFDVSAGGSEPAAGGDE